MKKPILLLCAVLLLCLCTKAQTLSGPSGGQTNNSTITITGAGETNDSFINLQGATPAPSGVPTVTSPANGNYTGVSLSNLTVTALYNPSTHAPSKFTVKVSNPYNVAVTAKFTISNFCFTDINNPASTFQHSLTVTLTINPSAPTSYGNVQEQEQFTKNDCGSGYAGESVDYIVPANKYHESTQAAANADATADINANGQAYANAHGGCSIIYYNVAMSQNFYNQTCASGDYASASVPYPVAAGKYNSTVSQADANAKAQADITANGQNYANANGPCAVTPKPVISGVTTSGSTITLNFYNTTPPYCTNAIEVIAVDNLTHQGFSSTNGTGTTMILSGWLTPGRTFTITVTAYDNNHNSSNSTSDPYTYTMPGQSPPVNTYYSVAESGTFTDQACGTGYIGSSVTYNVPPSKYTSMISQDDANQQAINDVNSNGQSYANAHGSCTAASGTPTVTTSFNGTSGDVLLTITPNIPNPYVSMVSYKDNTTGQTFSAGAGSPTSRLMTGLTPFHSYTFTVTVMGGGTPSSATAAPVTVYLPF